jgi:ferrous iron transport protein B
VRVWSFIKGAGGLIAGVLVVVWVLTAIPLGGGYRFGEVPIAESLFGRTTAAISPVLAPAGLDDWRISSALVTGFVAKEVVVGNLAQTFTAEPFSFAAESDEISATLAEQIHMALAASSGGYPLAAAAAFLAIVLAYTPCIATVAEQKRQYGLKWATAAALGQLALAWLLGVVVFQAGRLIGV